MESVAPPGGVMLSESTARLVEDAVVLADPEWVRIKGADEPVPVRRLVAIEPRHGLVGRPNSRLVGRRAEMAALDTMVAGTIGGRSWGRGGVEFRESHARDIPFHAVTRRCARYRRGGPGWTSCPGAGPEQVPDADPQDRAVEIEVV